MATVYPNGNRWRGQARVKGKNKSKTFDTKGAALNWAEELEHDMRSGRAILTGRTVRDALDRYKREVSPTKKGARWEIVRLNKFAKLPWSAKKLEDLKEEDLQAWIDNATVSAGTVLRDLSLLRSVLEKACKKWKWMSENPVRNVEKPARPRHRDRRIYDHEVKLVLKALGFSMRAKHRGPTWEIGHAFLLALETAMRRGEIWSLEWQYVHLDKRYVTLPETKNGSKRDVPLSSRAIKLLKFLGPKPEGQVYRTRVDSAEVMWRKKLTEAEITDLHFHDSRHEALTRLAKKIEVLDLARMVGHHDVRSLMIYYNETAEEIAAKLG